MDAKQIESKERNEKEKRWGNYKERNTEPEQ